MLIIPIIAFKSVDFPAPLGPIIETISFSFTSKSTPCKMFKPFTYPAAIPLHSITVLFILRS